MRYLVILVLTLGFFVSSCKKKEKSAGKSTEKLFSFNDLKADYSTIKQGDVTNITAQITGDATLSWSASAGDVFGSGKVVLFGASTCCTGNHDITCKATDKNNNSESKMVSVFVKQ